MHLHELPCRQGLYETCGTLRAIRGDGRFTLTVAHSGGAAVGFGYAFPCSADYWFGPDLVDRVPEAARTERLMGLCELAVQPDWQGRGIGSLLHAELIASVDPLPALSGAGLYLVAPTAPCNGRDQVGCRLYPSRDGSGVQVQVPCTEER
ncbi:GNAT family N-acetyltransferase [Streptomyces sp. SID4919]|nr:GNAT family N-acetyltransferase [Streptomyces sp. SID4919]